jgi:methionine synthase I (cobalamin-dependent)
MGTLLYSKGVFINRCYDELNLSQPDLIRQVHQEYFQAGAEVIETNTFGGNSFRLSRYSCADKVREINLAGAKLAHEAVTTRNLGMVFAVCIGGLILNTAISPDVLQQGQLFSTAAHSMTTGMHRVVLFGAVLSVLMALLAFIGLLRKSTVVESTEKLVKRQRKVMHKQFTKQVHNIAMFYKL